MDRKKAAKATHYEYQQYQTLHRKIVAEKLLQPNNKTRTSYIYDACMNAFEEAVKLRNIDNDTEISFMQAQVGPSPARITAKGIMSLLFPNGWAQDDMLDTLVQSEPNISNTVQYIDCQVGRSMINKGKEFRSSCLYPTVDNCLSIFGLLCVNNDHWVLLRLDCLRNRVEVWDTIRKNKKEGLKDIKSFIAAVSARRSDAIKKRGIEWSRAKIEWPDCIQQADDSGDCGWLSFWRLVHLMHGNESVTEPAGKLRSIIAMRVLDLILHPDSNIRSILEHKYIKKELGFIETSK